ncbi:Citron Rho-interacting kinase [Fusarium oxysporum f. sp. albedinis]|nr:Citron Rho-interacting kinase [Fusarium oxysporum f. sp. albedinis]
MLRQVALAALSVLPVALGQVAEDFESGWDKVAWPTYAPDCDQGGSVELDKTTAHSGKNSIKVTGGPNGFCGHKFFGTDAVPEGHVYVRTWMKTAKAFDDSHVTFITMPDAAQGKGKHLRIGGQSKIMMYNHESDDATLPDLSPDGIAASKNIPANTWQCLEYHLSPDGTIATWLNQGSEPLHPLHFGPSRVDVRFFRQLHSGCNTYSTGVEWMYTRGFISGFISGILRLFTTSWVPIQPHFQRLTLTLRPVAAVMYRQPR